MSANSPARPWKRLAAAALMLLAGPAAATSCLLLTSLMAFDSYSTISTTPLDTTATVQVSCTPGVGDPLATPYVLTIAGTGTSNDAVRSLSWLGSRLYYQVYSDVARSAVWGNGTTSGAGVAGSTTSSGTLLAGVRTHTAYARMPALQTVPAGVYLGTLLVTIDY